MAGTLAEFFVKVGLDAKEATKGLTDLSKNLKDVGKDLQDAGGKMTTWVTGPIVAAGAGIVALASSTANYADRLLDLTDITGMSSDSIQRWGYVAKMAGVDGETVTGAVEGLVRRLPALQAEGGKATEGLKKMGLSFSDLETMSPDDMISTLISKLSAMEDPMERNAIGSQLFGGEWKNLAPILGMGAEAIEKAKLEAYDMGAVMSGDALKSADDYRISMEQLQTQFTGVIREIAGNFLPILTNDVIPFIQNNVIPAFQWIADKISNLIKWFKALDPDMQKYIVVMIAIFAAMGPVISIIGGLISVLGFLLSPVGLAVAAIVALIAIGVALYLKWDEIVAWFKTVPDMIKKFFSGIYESMKDIGKNIIDGLWTGLKNAWDGLTRWISDAIAGLSKTAKKLLGIASPSKVFMGIGENVALGLAKGIDSASDMVVQSTIDMGILSINSLDGLYGNTSSNGIVQNVTINAPTELNPMEVARQTNKLARQLAVGLY